MSDPNQDRIQKVMDLPAPVPRVWSALTDHRKFGAWFRVALDGPFVVGEATTGWITLPGYEHVKWETITEQLVPETAFAFSWHPSGVDSETEYAAGAKILTQFRLEATETGTRLTLEESGFLQIPKSKRSEIVHSNLQGWDVQAKNLATYLA